MKITLCLLSLLFFTEIAGQISPSAGYRGETLTTTITSASVNMTVSSGAASTYIFSLVKGNTVILANNYNFFISNFGCQCADSVHIDFTIPINASAGYYDVHINYWNLPFDQILDSAFYVYATKIGGTVFFDADQDGTRDTSEHGIGYQTIIFNPGNTTILTGADGNYNAHLRVGSTNASVVVPANFTLTTPYATYPLNVPPDTLGNDFGLYTAPSLIIQHQLNLETDPIRCMQPSNTYCSVSSLSNNLQSGSLTLIKDSVLIYISSSVVPSSISSDTLRWYYTLQPFESLNLTLTFQGTAGIFHSVMVYDSLYDGNGYFITAETDSIYRLSTCSLDPNDKTVSPEGVGMNAYTGIHDTLQYTIRFQNCGNDTAFNVIINDIIDANLEMNTFSLLYSTHPVTVHILPGNEINFVMDNIQLPDSNVDEVRSHGMVVYTINPKNNLPEFTPVFNRADIYFDSNPSIMTNYTYNTLVTNVHVGIEIPVQNEKPYIFPNPISNESVLVLPDNNKYQLRIFNGQGKRMYTGTVIEKFVISNENFPVGIFYYQLTNTLSGDIFTGKFISIY
jgi:uncharacterized repeat protein (TIGR01451 family)